jgi:hypothetical protein
MDISFDNVGQEEQDSNVGVRRVKIFIGFPIMLSLNHVNNGIVKNGKVVVVKASDVEP